MKAKAASAAAKKTRPAVGRMVEDVVGCKWSMAVLAQVRRGVSRPGAIEREIPGLTTKVLNERLRKFVRFNVLERQVFPTVPPRVEYHLTRFGARFAKILDLIEALESEAGNDGGPPAGKRDEAARGASQNAGPRQGKVRNFAILQKLSKGKD